MNQNGKVSVIVPVYNAEKYLGYCLNSLLSQTYTNWEAILINDGSFDGSLEICKNYAELDSRFRVFTKENGGVSSARNYGLQFVQSKASPNRLPIDSFRVPFIVSRADSLMSISSPLTLRLHIPTLAASNTDRI